MVTATFTEVRNNFKHYCDIVEQDEAPITVVRERGENVIIVSESEWNAILETLHISGDVAMMEGLNESAQDIEAGRVSHYNSMAELRAEVLPGA